MGRRVPAPPGTINGDVDMDVCWQGQRIHDNGTTRDLVAQLRGAGATEGAWCIDACGRQRRLYATPTGFDGWYITPWKVRDEPHPRTPKIGDCR